jgi:hypothetical protein
LEVATLQIVFFNVFFVKPFLTFYQFDLQDISNYETRLSNCNLRSSWSFFKFGFWHSLQPLNQCKSQSSPNQTNQRKCFAHNKEKSCFVLFCFFPTKSKSIFLNSYLAFIVIL